MNLFERMVRSFGERRICIRIRQAHPELADVSDDNLIFRYLELATTELAKAEAAYLAAGEEATGGYPQATQLMVDTLPYFSDASRTSFVLLTIRQHSTISQLKADKAWLEQRLELATKLNTIYEDREVVFQQVLDEAGINAEMIDRMSINVIKRSVDINNRSN